MSGLTTAPGSWHQGFCIVGRFRSLYLKTRRPVNRSLWWIPGSSGDPGVVHFQWRAGPVGLQPEEVERAGHVHVVEAGPGRARRAPWLVAWRMVPSTPARRA
jgi:hypothetical protein